MYTWSDGERFDKDALRHTWLGTFPPKQYSDFSADGMVIVDPLEEEEPDDLRLPRPERILKSKSEIVDFVGRFDIAEVHRLAATPGPYDFSGVMRRLVVASPIPDKPDEVIDGV